MKMCLGQWSLSILYLRCAVLNAVLTAVGQNAQTFNSLFEMRETLLRDDERRDG